MTAPALSIDQAAALLGQYGYTVKKHGARYLAALAAESPKVYDTHELLALAREYVQPAAPATERQLAALDQADRPDGGALPLGALLVALEAHAAALPQRFDATHPIPLPATLPQRFDAPLDLITPGRYQPRVTFDQAELDELAASIAEHGVLNPLLVVANEAGRLELVAGERRLRAARQLGLSFVPVDLRSYTLRQMAEISGIDNIQRAGLTAPEEGAYFNRLIAELGISENELSKRLGKNRAYIQQRRAIASAAPEVLQALAEDRLTFSQARAIALAAPGDVKAQQQAMKKLAEWAKQGRRFTEGDARGQTEAAVLARSTKALQALGWTIEKAYSYTLIWAPTERPRAWTGAEMLAAIKDKRAPGTDRPAELDGNVIAERIAVLDLKYRIDRTHAPWIGLYASYNDAPTFYSHGELAAIAEPVAQAWQAWQARAAAAGWTLTRGSGHYRCAHPQGAAQMAYSWADVEPLLAQIEAGKVSAAAPKASGSSAAPQKCDGCKKPSGMLEYVDDRRLCKACATKVKAELKARKERIAGEVRGVMGAWLLAAPPDALRLLGALFSQRAWDEKTRQERTAQIRAADPATFAATVLTRVVEHAVEYHASPVYDVAAQPAQPSPPAADFDAALLDLVGDPAFFVRQTRRALPLLERVGLATVAGAIKAIARRLPDVPPAEQPAPASLPGSTPDDSPLGAIVVSTRAIAARWRHEREAELRAELDTLMELAEQLDWLADDETVDDAVFEATSRQLQELARTIREQLEGLPVPTLESEAIA